MKKYFCTFINKMIYKQTISQTLKRLCKLYIKEFINNTKNHYYLYCLLKFHILHVSSKQYKATIKFLKESLKNYFMFQIKLNTYSKLDLKTTFVQINSCFFFVFYFMVLVCCYILVDYCICSFKIHVLVVKSCCLFFKKFIIHFSIHTKV